MTRFLRAICLTLLAAFMASLVLHAPADALDMAEHTADAVAEAHGLEVTGHAHPDCGDERGDTVPGHHHSGADNHGVAILDHGQSASARLTATHVLDWPQDRLPLGVGSDGPDQPPKRLLTLA